MKGARFVIVLRPQDFWENTIAPFQQKESSPNLESKKTEKHILGKKWCHHCKIRWQKGSWKKETLTKDFPCEFWEIFEGALEGLTQFLATECPSKMMKNAFYFTLKALFVLKIFQFLSRLFCHVEKRLD